MLTNPLRTTLISVIVACVTALASGAGAADFELGACVHLAQGKQTPEAVVSLLRKANLTSLRDDVYWSAVEQQQGVLTFPDKYKGLESAVKAIHSYGGRPLLILDFGNKFYDNGGLITSQAGLDAFARYATFVVKHFGDNVDRYEVWNEWNSGFGSNPKQDHGDPVAYVHLLKSAYQAVKVANPKAVVVGGVTAGVDATWTKAFIEAGGLQYLDAFSVHSYTLFKLHPNPEAAVAALDGIHAQIAAASPKREIPIYISEMGYTTYNGPKGVTEQMAMAYLIRFLALARARPWMTAVWWYDLVDDGPNDSDMESRFGLLRGNAAPKPQYAAMARLAPLLTGSTEVQAYRLAGGGYAVSGAANGTQWVVAWKIEPPARNWPSGNVAAIEGKRDYEWTYSALPDDGVPVLWTKQGPTWVPEHFVVTQASVLQPH